MATFWEKAAHSVDHMFLNVFELFVIFELRHEKTYILVSDLVRHKPGCTAT